MKQVVLFLFCFLFTGFAEGAYTIIKGTAPSYRGDELVFKTYKDYITLDEKELFRVKVDSSGSFYARVPVEEILYVFIYLGIYKGHFYMEPGKEYNLIFPDKQEKTPADKTNPFFEYTEFMIGISKGGMYELNFMIKSFDNSYYPYFNKLAMNVRGRNNPQEVERAIAEMQKPWDTVSHPFFRQYIRYRIGMLQWLAYQHKAKAISKEYFQHNPVLYHHIAYMDLFRQVYDKYFYYFSTTPEGKVILDDINKKKSYSALKKSLQQDEVLQDPCLLEMVVLKNLHDNFYTDMFSREALLAVLDSLAASTAYPIHKEIASNIRGKVTSLMPGFYPPPFHLYDHTNTLKSLDDFKGYYVYLNFCACNSYSCMKEFIMLNQLNEKYGSKVKIVSVICDGTPQEMKDFLLKNKYRWTFLHFSNQPEILDAYRIKAYPVYLFLDKEGRIIHSPCPSPAENFEEMMIKILKKSGDLPSAGEGHLRK